MQTTSPEDRLMLNRRRARALAAGFGAWVFLITTLIFWILTGWLSLFIAPVIGLVVAIVWVVVARKSGHTTILDLSEVEPADERLHARLLNAAGALSATTGVVPPELYVVDDTAINAMAVGRSARQSAVAVTTGLLDAFDIVEIEAVLALVFYRIKSEQIVPETLVVPTLGAGAVLAEQVDGMQWLQRFLTLPMPVIDRFLLWVHPADEEFDADIASTLITRYPPALASALAKMDGRSALAMGTVVTAHLWLAPSVNIALQPLARAVHKPLKERVAVLQEL